MVMGVQQVGFLTAERAPGAILCNTVGGHAMALVVIMIAQLDHIVTITLFLTAAANLGRALLDFGFLESPPDHMPWHWLDPPPVRYLDLSPAPPAIYFGPLR